MAVQVKWFATLVKRTKSKQAVTTVEWTAGLTPLAVFKAEGFNDADAEAVLVLINDAQSDQQAALADGDRLEFMVSIQGGDLRRGHAEGHALAVHLRLNPADTLDPGFGFFRRAPEDPDVGERQGGEDSLQV